MKDAGRKSFAGYSRRDFLKLGTILAGLAATGCHIKPGRPDPGAAFTPAPSTYPVTAGLPALTGVAPAYQVAIAQAKSYDRILVKQKIQAMLEELGGWEELIRPGKRVALKINLTSGMHFNPPTGFTAPESYVTHPEVVRALGELLMDSGVKDLFVVEAVYDDLSFPSWGFTEVAQGLGASLVDLNLPAPYPNFVSIPTGTGWFVYESFTLNPILQEVDTFISVTKMKCHYNCGITLSMKNLIGLAPSTRYRLSPDHWWRSAFHGNEKETPTRLPRVILDLNRARPIHLSVIDGIMTAEGGATPRGTFKPVQPGILLMGKNPVATDFVATAAMGFDPLASPPQPPFIRADNYLALAGELGLGPRRLSEIGVVGASLDDVTSQFEPAREE